MKNRSISQRHFLLLLTASAALAAACGENNSKPSDGSPSTVTDSLLELERGLNTCAEAQKSCVGDSDAGTDQCRSSFDSCRDAAHADLGPKLDDKVNECASAARTCREAATTDEAKGTCTEQLRACTGADRVKPEKPEKPEPDAGETEHVSKSPVVECITALHTCIDGVDPAKTCADALRVCMGMTVGNGHDDAGKPDAGKPDDVGNPDAGKPDGAGNPDAGKPDSVGKPDGGDTGKPDGGDTGKPDGGDTGKPDSAADPSKPDAGMAGESAACKQAFEQCLTAGGTREDCARARKDCRE